MWKCSFYNTSSKVSIYFNFPLITILCFFNTLDLRGKPLPCFFFRFFFLTHTHTLRAPCRAKQALTHPFSHHFSSLLRWARLPQREDVAADWDLPPDAGLGVLAEAVPGVHDQHTVGGQAVHLTVRSLPLGSLLLREPGESVIRTRMG